jgi:hypothetical protein
MTHPAFGNNVVVGNALHIGATPLKHCNFHAGLLIEMHVQRHLESAAFARRTPKADISAFLGNSFLRLSCSCA